MPAVLRVDDPAAPHVAELLGFHLAELRGEMAEFAFALDATGLSQPGVTFWTAWVDDTLAGFVALKDMGDCSGELKSMRAAPAMRGKGIGRALLNHVIAEGRRRGLARIDLETGTAALHAPAVSLYRSAGFVACGPFGTYAASPYNQFMTLSLQETPCPRSS
jgi:putative acetyltransferase